MSMCITEHVPEDMDNVKKRRRRTADLSLKFNKKAGKVRSGNFLFLSLDSIYNINMAATNLISANHLQCNYLAIEPPVVSCPTSVEKPHPFRKSVYLSSFVAAFGGALCGYDTGCISSIM